MKASLRQATFSSALQALLDDAKVGALLATAQGNPPYDFVSRFLRRQWAFPKTRSPVRHMRVLAPFWAKRLGKKRFALFKPRRAAVIFCVLMKARA